MRNCSGTKFQLDFKCAVLRHRRQYGVLPVDAKGDEAKGSEAFNLGNWSAITGTEGVDTDVCVWDVVVESMLTWATLVVFRDSSDHFCFHSGRSAGFWCASCLTNAMLIASWSATLHDMQGHGLYHVSSSSNTSACCVESICRVHR